MRFKRRISLLISFLHLQSQVNRLPVFTPASVGEQWCISKDSDIKISFELVLLVCPDSADI